MMSEGSFGIIKSGSPISFSYCHNPPNFEDDIIIPWKMLPFVLLYRWIWRFLQRMSLGEHFKGLFFTGIPSTLIFMISPSTSHNLANASLFSTFFSMQCECIRLQMSGFDFPLDLLFWLTSRIKIQRLDYAAYYDHFYSSICNHLKTYYPGLTNGIYIQNLDVLQSCSPDLGLFWTNLSIRYLKLFIFFFGASRVLWNTNSSTITLNKGSSLLSAAIMTKFL